jgi:hypothetical protein
LHLQARKQELKLRGKAASHKRKGGGGKRERKTDWYTETKIEKQFVKSSSSFLYNYPKRKILWVVVLEEEEENKTNGD